MIQDWLAGHTPIDNRERHAMARMTAELARLPDPTNEHADPTHLTASAFVIGPQGVLLLRHKRLGIWLQPGGHVEAGEALADAARREAEEETGLAMTLLDPDPVHVDVHAGGRGHTHLDVRFLFAADGVPAPPPGESPDVRWFTEADARRIADPGLLGALDLIFRRTET